MRYPQRVYTTLKKLERQAFEEAELNTMERQAQYGRLSTSSGTARISAGDKELWVITNPGSHLTHRHGKLAYIESYNYWLSLVHETGGTYILRPEALALLAGTAVTV